MGSEILCWETPVLWAQRGRVGLHPGRQWQRSYSSHPLCPLPPRPPPLSVSPPPISWSPYPTPLSQTMSEKTVGTAVSPPQLPTGTLGPEGGELCGCLTAQPLCPRLNQANEGLTLFMGSQQATRTAGHLERKVPKVPSWREGKRLRRASVSEGGAAPQLRQSL